MRKIASLTVIVILIASIGFSRLQFLATQEQQTPRIQEVTTHTVTFIFPDARETATVSGETVFDVTQRAANQESLDLETKHYDFGTLIESIGGVKNSADTSWTYTVNGTFGDVAADKKSLLPGDTVEWTYRAYEQ